MWRRGVWTCHPGREWLYSPGHCAARLVAVSTAFLVTSMLVIVTPGTGAVYTLSAGLSRGRRAGIIAAFGCTLGIVPHLVAALLGAAALLRSSPLAFQVVK